MPALSSAKRSFYITYLGLSETSKLDLDTLENMYFAALTGKQGSTSSLRRDYLKSIGYNDMSAWLSSLGYVGSIASKLFNFFATGPVSSNALKPQTTLAPSATLTPRR